MIARRNKPTSQPDSSAFFHTKSTLTINHQSAQQNFST
jgi:hypothetical protein